MSALHAESKYGWTFRQDYRATIKFRGNLKVEGFPIVESLFICQVTPTGPCIVEIPVYNDLFSWIKSPTTVHNVFIGKMYTDQVDFECFG